MGTVVEMNSSTEDNKKPRVRKILVGTGEDNFEAAERIFATQKEVVPFDSIDEINAVVTYLLENSKFRDACLFVLGCNSTLRIGDILKFRWRNILNEDGEVKDAAAIVEDKNQNPKRIYTNDAVRAAVQLYVAHLDREPEISAFMFMSEGRRKRAGEIKWRSDAHGDPHIGPKPITEQLVSKMIRDTTRVLGLSSETRRFSTHSMRKTGARCAVGDLKGRDLPEELSKYNAGLERVRDFMGHKDVSTTRKYIRSDEKYNEKTYKWMNLGLEAIQEYIKAHDKTVVS